MLSCDVIIWDDNTPLFYFSWKLHSLIFRGEGGGGVHLQDVKRKCSFKKPYVLLVLLKVRDSIDFWSKACASQFRTKKICHLRFIQGLKGQQLEMIFLPFRSCPVRWFRIRIYSGFGRKFAEIGSFLCHFANSPYTAKCSWRILQMHLYSLSVFSMHAKKLLAYP